MDRGVSPASLTHLNRKLLENILMADSLEETALQTIVDCAMEAGPVADSCGLLVRRRRGRFERGAVTADPAGRLLEEEIALGDGPAIAAAEGAAPVVVADPGAETRWPGWAAAAGAADLCSVLAVPLTYDGTVLGALTWYAETRDAFDADALEVARTFGDLASTAAATAQTVVGLRHAMRSRHVIGIAQGILMQRYDMGEEAAFDVLRRYSNQDNVKLRGLAERVIQERSLPDRAPESE